MRHLVITVLFFVLFAEAGAQSTLTGKITSQEKPVDYAQVYVLSLGGSIIATTTSDSLGIYRLQLETTADSLVVNISRLGFKPWQTTIPSGLSKLDVQLVMSSNSRLKDFVVTGRKPVSQQGDTLRYHAEKFQDGTERNVEELLAKLPGVSVDEKSGVIKYQGKKIKKILLDGDDLTGDNYQVLSKNMSADWLEGVEVLKRFNDSRLMHGVRESDEVAINLKLKEEAKSPLFGSAETGLGSRPNYKAEAELLSYSKGFKLFAPADANNTGEDLEVYNLDTYNDSQLTYKGFILPQQVVRNRLNPPDFLTPERFTFHEGQFGSASFVANLSEKSSMRSITTLYNNRIDFNFSDSLFYFLSENNGFSFTQRQNQRQMPFQVFQDLKLESKIASNQDVIFRFQAKLNRDNTITRNKVKRGDFRDKYQSNTKEWFVGGTYINKISNNWVNSFDIEMGNNLWDEKFTVSQNRALTDSIRQDIGQNFFNFGVFNQLDGVINKSWYVNILSGWSINRSSLGFNPNTLLSENTYKTNHYQFSNLFTELKVKKSLKSLKFTAGARLRNAGISYRNKNSNELYLEPIIATGFEKKMNSFGFHIKGLYNVEYSFLNPNRLVNQPLFTNYRNTVRYSSQANRPIRKEFRIASVKLEEYSYSFLSANAEWVFANSSGVLVPRLDFLGDAVITSFNGNEKSRGFYSTYSLDKYFSIIASTVKVSYERNVIKTPQSIKAIENESEITQSILSITSGTSLAKSLNLSMACKMHDFKNIWGGNKSQFAFNTYFMRWVCTPIDPLRFSIEAQAINFRGSRDIRGIMNARIDYTLKKDKLSFTFKANNLTNQRGISWSTLDSSVFSNSVYPLQPRFYFISVDFKL